MHLFWYVQESLLAWRKSELKSDVYRILISHLRKAKQLEEVLYNEKNKEKKKQLDA